MTRYNRRTAIIRSSRSGHCDDCSATSWICILANVRRTSDYWQFVVCNIDLLCAGGGISSSVCGCPGNSSSANWIVVGERLAVTSATRDSYTGTIVSCCWHATIACTTLVGIIIEILVAIAGDHRLLGIIHCYFKGAGGQSITRSIFQS